MGPSIADKDSACLRGFITIEHVKSAPDHTQLFSTLTQLIVLEYEFACAQSPPGDPTPSQADIQMTKAIIDIATPLGISVYDHIIVGKSGHASFKGLKLIWASVAVATSGN
jgi:hypothetical protein